MGIFAEYSYVHSCNRFDLMYYKNVMFSSMFCQSISDTTISVEGQHSIWSPRQSFDTSQCDSKFPLGTCGSLKWTNEQGLQNLQLCITDWATEGKINIPYCGPPNQVCVIVGVKRTKAGKPLRCTVKSYSTIKPPRRKNLPWRTWVMEVGEGCECKAACYNADKLEYTVINPGREFSIIFAWLM